MNCDTEELFSLKKNSTVKVKASFECDNISVTFLQHTHYLREIVNYTVTWLKTVKTANLNGGKKASHNQHLNVTTLV